MENNIPKITRETLDKHHEDRYEAEECCNTIEALVLGDVVEEVEIYDRLLEDLEKCVYALEEKLELVLQPKYDAGECNGEVVKEKVQLGSTLRGSNNRLSYRIEELRSLNYRINI